MSEDAAISKKVKKAAQLLLYQHHRLPGSKGWEIKKVIGKDYMNVIKLLERKLDDLGLEIKIVYPDGIDRVSPTEDDLEQARFTSSPRSRYRAARHRSLAGGSTRLQFLRQHSPRSPPSKGRRRGGRSRSFSRRSSLTGRWIRTSTAS